MAWPGDEAMFGVDLVVGPGRIADQDAPDFKARVKRILETSARYLGHEPEELAGLRIVLRDGPADCTAIGTGAGCYSPDTNTITIDAAERLESPGFAKTCIEDLVIPHELVHYFEYDPDHQGPHFALWFFKPLWKQLHTGTLGCDRWGDLYGGQWAGRLKPDLDARGDEPPTERPTDENE